jgi:hypothetical protein
VDAALDRPFGDVEQVSDLEPGQVPRVAQGEDEAVTGVELVKRAVKLANGDGVVELTGRCRQIEIEFGKAALLLRCPKRPSDHLSAKPCGKGMRIAERVKTEPGGKQRVLDSISSGVRGTCDQASGSKCTGEMRGDELAECVTVASPGSFHEDGWISGRTRPSVVHTY